MPVITLSGATGTGALEVGQMVADRLHADYVDREILVSAARSLAVTPEEVAVKETPSTGLGDRVSRLLRSFVEQSARAGSWDPMAGEAGLEFLLGRTYAEATALPQTGHWLDDQTYIRTLHSIISDIASRRDVVIVGRGSQVILRDAPRTLHTLLVCPKGLRISRIMEREGLDADAAKHRVEENDRGRVAFHKKYFKVEVDDPHLYHLVVDTSRFSYEDAADLVCRAATLQAPRSD